MQCYRGKHFEIKDLGTLNYYLKQNMLLTSQSIDLVLLTQPHLQHLWIQMCNSLLLMVFLWTIPLCIDNYVGSLIYLNVTHWDITYAVHIVSQFIAALRTIPFNILPRILHYIKGTLGHGLHITRKMAYDDSYFLS